ncbi:uncharacterized protein F4812DRAFT_158107 [Daldinia caldariorum]|uniref:uncharacterized protein n=1 Tax=Daldinia caldariorum TaxID=326644 RepID=UPI002008841F|nr:uncharacterized protein F4812DRAFT_158107 [Daldinia caldariorum]KAI1464528.1 hypothetical protein F4812DRAFT_158107 [Daldinia caldariorum]
MFPSGLPSLHRLPNHQSRNPAPAPANATEPQSVCAPCDVYLLSLPTNGAGAAAKCAMSCNQITHSHILKHVSGSVLFLCPAANQFNSQSPLPVPLLSSFPCRKFRKSTSYAPEKQLGGRRSAFFFFFADQGIFSSCSRLRARAACIVQLAARGAEGGGQGGKTKKKKIEERRGTFLESATIPPQLFYRYIPGPLQLPVLFLYRHYPLRNSLFCWHVGGHTTIKFASLLFASPVLTLRGGSFSDGLFRLP